MAQKGLAVRVHVASDLGRKLGVQFWRSPRPPIFTVTVYYSERKQIKVSRGNRCPEQGPREPRSKVLTVLSRGTYPFPNDLWQHTHSPAGQ